MEYYYEAQMKKLLVQFLAVFVGLKVKSGKTNELDERFIDVQVKNGSSSRVVAAILNDNTQNAVVRLPLIAGHLLTLNWTHHFDMVHVPREQQHTFLLVVSFHLI